MFQGEDYQLFWPETIDFVRMAGMMGAIIVPFGAVGIADSVNMLLDGGEIERLPYFGERAREFNKRVPQARVGVNQVRSCSCLASIYMYALPILTNPHSLLTHPSELHCAHLDSESSVSELLPLRTALRHARSEHL